jgi:hypothetical protein
MSGVVVPIFTSYKTNSILDSVDYGSPYAGNGGYSIGGKLEVEPIKNLALGIDILSTSVSYFRTLSKPTGWKLDYSESLGYLELPMYLKKSFKVREKFFPYFSIGAGLMQLSRSFANLDLSYDATDPKTFVLEHDKLVQFQLNQRSLRTTISYEWLIGAGISYKVNNFRFSLDGRYTGGLNNMMNATNRFGNAELIFLYNYIDNSVLLNKLQLGVSVSYILKYTVKKVKDANY